MLQRIHGVLPILGRLWTKHPCFHCFISSLCWNKGVCPKVSKVPRKSNGFAWFSFLSRGENPILRYPQLCGKAQFHIVACISLVSISPWPTHDNFRGKQLVLSEALSNTAKIEVGHSILFQYRIITQILIPYSYWWSPWPHDMIPWIIWISLTIGYPIPIDNNFPICKK